MRRGADADGDAHKMCTKMRKSTAMMTSTRWFCWTKDLSLLLICVAILCDSTSGFQVGSTKGFGVRTTHSPGLLHGVGTMRFAAPGGGDQPPAENEKSTGNNVEVGSKEYLEGFLSTPVEEQRGDGLEQALKLGGGFAVGLAVLFLGFMASNGLL